MPRPWSEEAVTKSSDIRFARGGPDFPFGDTVAQVDRRLERTKLYGDVRSNVHGPKATKHLSPFHRAVVKVSRCEDFVHFYLEPPHGAMEVLFYFCLGACSGPTT